MTRHWYASARQRVAVDHDGQRSYRPWGQVHLREIGARRSACGQLTPEWHLFYDLEASASTEPTAAVCPVCQMVVNRLEEGAQRPTQARQR